MNKIAIISDIHVPFQHDEDLNRALLEIKNEKPDAIVIAGDLVDFWELSKFDKVPNFGKLVKEEIALAKDILTEIRRDNPQAKIYLIEGNHEFRIKAYAIRNAPALYDEYFLRDALELSKLKITWVGTKHGSARWTDTYIDIEGMHIGHFDRVNQGSGQTARQLMMKKGGSFVQGHVHRAAIVYFRDIDGNITFGVENPCLCKDAFYGSANDWQRGYSIIEKREEGWRPRIQVF